MAARSRKEKGATAPDTLAEDLRGLMHEHLAKAAPRDRVERLAMMGAWQAGVNAAVEELRTRLGNALEKGGLAL